MKLIPLTKGLFAKVDDEDYERLMQYKWCAAKGGNFHYAQRSEKLPNGGKRPMYMSRFIMGVTDRNVYVDHIDHDTLNNQKYNLRTCTPRENAINATCKGGVVKYTGVDIRRWKTKSGKVNWAYRARLRVLGKTIGLGTGHKTAESAARAYDEAAKKYFGEFACLNFPEQHLKRA